MKKKEDKRQSLRRVVDNFGPFPSMFPQLNPSYKEGHLTIPFYGHGDSKSVLAMNKIALFGLSKRATTKEVYEKFTRLDKKEKECIAYDFSHKIKIASLAAYIALRNQNSNIYEVGVPLGLSSLHYSRCIKEKEIPPSKPVYKLTVIEINKNYVERAKKMRGTVDKSFITKVEYLNEDATTYLRNCKAGDIIFASLAQPDVCNTILKLSNLRRINFVISYGSSFGFENFENQIDPEVYEVYPFEDREYNLHVPEDIRDLHMDRRYGVLVLVKKQ